MEQLSLKKNLVEWIKERAFRNKFIAAIAILYLLFLAVTGTIQGIRIVCDFSPFLCPRPAMEVSVLATFDPSKYAEFSTDPLTPKDVQLVFSNPSSRPRFISQIRVIATYIKDGVDFPELQGNSPEEIKAVAKHGVKTQWPDHVELSQFLVLPPLPAWPKLLPKSLSEITYVCCQRTLAALVHE